jgi:hypothetical protein
MIKKYALMLIMAVCVAAAPAAGQGQLLDSTKLDMFMTIDKFAKIEFAQGAPEYVSLEAQANGQWQGFTTMTVTNNFPVVVAATITPYAPSIVQGGDRFDCLLEGDTGGFDGDGESMLVLDPYPDGFIMKIWAAIKNPNLLARPSHPDAQKVAEIVITISDFQG